MAHPAPPLGGRKRMVWFGIHWRKPGTGNVLGLIAEVLVGLEGECFNAF